MLEQMKQIAECLNENGLEWSCCFTTSREIAGRQVRFTIQDTEKCLAMTAHLPERIDDMDCERYKDLAERLNRRVEFGAFRVDEDEMALTFHIYNMRTRLGEIKDRETVAFMLDQCRAILEKYADALVLSHTPTLFEQAREKLYDLLHVNEYEDDAEAEDEYDDPYDEGTSWT